MSDKWLRWAQEIQALAQSGLAFSKDMYDRERYERLRLLSAEIMAEYTHTPMEKIEELFMGETGYPTPKVDVRAVIFQEDKILLVKEKMDNRWSLPGGFCDIGLSPAENIVKEVQEEAGYLTVATRLLAVLDMQKHPHPPQAYHYYKLFFACDIISGEAREGLETKDVAFFKKDELPSLSIARNTDSQLRMLFAFLDEPTKGTIYD
ncbi:NUDIX hydrolase [Priestia taiwanensis]|uniref:ADP-ribose pyrophosphatase YjhB n=1 Tax=Priestia taiwanensis TaxID=1347902 RepID=A0A917AVM4_9BACI|nr:NUDIX hydrolase [Priestia taiwanensis]MBM7364701.1 ADP-ribose pyrophosphatase YjhB (NUDIX family) [Priestia taiwanensis]GGE78981.1 putative ADP-ribose pyrophosphatase YjhB [Priestia taiwanensis]